MGISSRLCRLMVDTSLLAVVEVINLPGHFLFVLGTVVVDSSRNGWSGFSVRRKPHADPVSSWKNPSISMIFHKEISIYCTGWWFGICFIFPNSWHDDPIWLIFFRGVETTIYCSLGIFQPRLSTRGYVFIHDHSCSWNRKDQNNHTWAMGLVTSGYCNWLVTGIQLL